MFSYIIHMLSGLANGALPVPVTLTIN